MSICPAAVRHFPLAAILLMGVGCKKDKNQPPDPVDPVAICQIVSETSDQADDPYSLTYEYGNDGLLNSVLKRRTPSNAAIDTLFFYDNKVRRSDTDGDWLRYEYSAPVHVTTTAIPATGSLVKHGASGTEADYYEFVYSYDSRQRLTKIDETTPDFAGDYEWSLSVSYNGDGNVSTLQFGFTTGPAIAPKVTVTGYDKKPTPYRPIPNYRFFMNKYHWNNPDVEALITALSVNNPTGYTVETPLGSGNCTMTYTYNEQGYPASRVVTEKSGSTTKIKNQTFSYSCKE